MKISDVVNVEVTLTSWPGPWVKPKWTPLARRVLHRQKVKRRLKTRAFKEFIKCWDDREAWETTINPCLPWVPYPTCSISNFASVDINLQAERGDDDG